MLTRIATGLVLAPALVALVLLGPLAVLWSVLALAGLIAMDECARMTLPRGAFQVGDRWLAVAAGASLFAGAVLGREPGLAIGLAGGVGLAMVGVMARFDDVAVAGRRVVGVLASLAYVGVLFSIVLLLLHLGDPLGRHVLMLLFLTVFLGDTAAYFVGRALGRHRLAPRVSPKKTWEGAVGGLAGSIGGAFIARALFLGELSPVDAAVIGVGAAVIEQVGDLAESLLKRAYDIKDSGTLLPGHGGMLDRVDGVVFASAWIYTYFSIFS